ncbi:hypothetical protein CHH48_17165 [Terribacillus saccharophilus]|uniref:Uncharacterized protein n=1 Tax=Terribacillus saccharophilus TaxID=361277 RepID=A0ABX4GUG7_9BACI|nr:hypothetical protein CHH56_16760 [Terribacillus saccharophilus]PAD94711.1 hypothetical protein CHH50_16840 [Terribacillus saccharophilus]PAD98517.1 hypothetical protein CHH48_17165 [Terribacillus saccharophilus]
MENLPLAVVVTIFSFTALTFLVSIICIFKRRNLLISILTALVAIPVFCLSGMYNSLMRGSQGNELEFFFYGLGNFYPAAYITLFSLLFILFWWAKYIASLISK